MNRSLLTGALHERRVVGHVSGWKEQMRTCVCGKPWPCPDLYRPCPFCRDLMEEHEIVHGELDGKDAIAVGCRGCQAHGPMALTEAEAQAKWNAVRLA